MEIIKSISGEQEEIIKNILHLYNNDEPIELDPTFSKGIFYKNTGIEVPKYIFDISPQNEQTKQADCRELPFSDNSIKSIMFDPPFLATTGSSLNKDNNSNLMVKRFGGYRNEQELHQFYYDSLKEFYRILKKDGILIFKCQDKISSGNQYLSHVFIINKAIELGYYPKDLFILTAKSRLVAEWQAKNQKHARKFHCYFIVFQKKNKVIKYT